MILCHNFRQFLSRFKQVRSLGTVAISNNRLSNINGDDIRVTTAGNTQIQLSLDSNTITRDTNESGFTGIRLVVGDDSVTTATISNNNIANCIFSSHK